MGNECLDTGLVNPAPRGRRVQETSPVDGLVTGEWEREGSQWQGPDGRSTALGLEPGSQAPCVDTGTSFNLWRPDLSFLYNGHDGTVARVSVQSKFDSKAEEPGTSGPPHPTALRN